MAIALATNWNWLYSTDKVAELERLGLDLTSNVVPLEPHLYYNPEGVQAYYLMLRYSARQRYYVAKKG